MKQRIVTVVVLDGQEGFMKGVAMGIITFSLKMLVETAGGKESLQPLVAYRER